MADENKRLIAPSNAAWASPATAAPPLTPNTGPSDGSRMHSAAFRPSLRSACVTPTVTVDFPSPAGVGLIPVTSTKRPLGLRRVNACRRIFALYLPYSSTSSSVSPSSAAIAATGRSFAACAMAISVGTFAVVVTDPFALERGCEPRPEHATGVLRGPVRDLPDRRPARPGERLGHVADERRLVPFATMRHGREIGRVRLDQQAVGGTGGPAVGPLPGLGRPPA